MAKGTPMTEDCKETGFSGEGRCIEPAVEDGRCVEHAGLRSVPPRCRRVTGKAWEPHYWTLPEEQRGPRREKDEVNPREGRIGLNRHGVASLRETRLQPVYDVLCGITADYWVKPQGSREVANCCTRCLSAVVDDLGPTVVVGVLKQCRERDRFGGRCAYALGHSPEMNHRFVGGDEDARHDFALEQYHLEKQQREDPEVQDAEESFASRMGHPGGHYG